MRKILLAFFAAGVFAGSQAALAEDPLGLDGIYKASALNGFDIPGIRLAVTGTNGGVYIISVQDTFTLPIVGCQVNAGQQYILLTPLGDGVYQADITAFDPVFASGLPCPTRQEVPKNVTIELIANVLFLRFVGAPQLDQFFAREDPQLPPAATPTPEVQDLSVPTVSTSSLLKATAGKIIKITYFVSDNSGFATVIVGIKRRGRFLKFFPGTLSPAVAGTPYTVNWKSPKDGAGKTYVVHILGVDGAGNQSAVAIGKIKLIAHR